MARNRERNNSRPALPWFHHREPRRKFPDKSCHASRRTGTAVKNNYFAVSRSVASNMNWLKLFQSPAFRKLPLQLCDDRPPKRRTRSSLSRLSRDLFVAERIDRVDAGGFERGIR